jgi:hypothetical protein
MPSEVSTAHRHRWVEQSVCYYLGLLLSGSVTIWVCYYLGLLLSGSGGGDDDACPLKSVQRTDRGGGGIHHDIGLTIPFLSPSGLVTRW